MACTYLAPERLLHYNEVMYRSSTASLRSSIYQRVEEYGRTYHAYKEGSESFPTTRCSSLWRSSYANHSPLEYMLPNDEVSL